LKPTLSCPQRYHNNHLDHHSSSLHCRRSRISRMSSSILSPTASEFLSVFRRLSPCHRAARQLNKNNETQCKIVHGVMLLSCPPLPNAIGVLTSFRPAPSHPYPYPYQDAEFSSAILCLVPTRWCCILIQSMVPFRCIQNFWLLLLSLHDLCLNLLASSFSAKSCRTRHHIYVGT
jgi:hypothetical protein